MAETMVVTPYSTNAWSVNHKWFLARILGSGPEIEWYLSNISTLVPFFTHEKWTERVPSPPVSVANAIVAEELHAFAGTINAKVLWGTRPCEVGLICICCLPEEHFLTCSTWQQVKIWNPGTHLSIYIFIYMFLPYCVEYSIQPAVLLSV